MSGSIRLHPEKGLNPKLTYCPRCGGEGRDLMLIGTRENVFQCGYCKITIFGHTVSEPCPKCQDRGPHTFVRKIEDHEKLPGGLCLPCEKETTEHDKVVAEGGIHFTCSDCKKGGVIKASAPLSKIIREHHQKEGGDKLAKGWFTEPIHVKGNDKVYLPCGVQFTKADGCPVCGTEEPK
jgi:hypothetical protein